MVNLEQDLKERMKRLGVEVIQLVECLPPRQATGILAKQLIRCATSVGANYRAACSARSKADFIAKLAIAEEESDETLYWLEMLQDLKLLEQETFDSPKHKIQIPKCLLALSSNGLGRGPLKAEIRVRFPLRLQKINGFVFCTIPF